jgi:hypothetical protein
MMLASEHVKKTFWGKWRHFFLVKLLETSMYPDALQIYNTYLEHFRLK